MKFKKGGYLFAVSTLERYQVLGYQQLPLGNGKHHRTFLVSGCKGTDFKKSLQYLKVGKL